jgi:hypothetical protein|tara:strand:+ start:36 stop:272 length:237 start_codon:yes stop_codon:yes gene_type:complete
MKKILGIIVLSLLLSGNVHSAAIGDHLFKRSIFEKAGDALDDLNPLNYFKKRKKCQAIADRMDTVRIGKIRYKECMDR